MLKKLNEKIDEVQRLFKLSDELLETDEPEADRLYAEAYRLNGEAAEEISRITGGRIDVEAASHMVWEYPERLKEILKKA